MPRVGLIIFRKERFFEYALAVLAMHGVYGYSASRVQFGWRIAHAIPVAIGIYWWEIKWSAIVTLSKGRSAFPRCGSMIDSWPRFSGQAHPQQ